MKHPLFWIIDDEWGEHSLEVDMIRKAFPDCEIKLSGVPFAEDLKQFGAEADVVLAQISAEMTTEVIAGLKKCRGIAVFGSGYNNVDVAAAKARGIPVTNVNGYCTEDIADYVLSVIFYFYKNIAQLSSNIGNGAWGAEALLAPVNRLGEQYLLLMGFGYIGKVTAKRAMALGMNVLVYDPYIPDDAVRSFGAEPVTVEEGLARADFVSIHVKLTEQTAGLVNAEFLRKMKPSAVLINVARGPLVNEDDLVCAVHNGVIRGAVLDVVCKEPISLDSPLLREKNILVTPHISYASEQSVRDLRSRAVENALAMYRGEVPADLIQC